ncbi:hypothetical protein E4K72_02695 [Oxalobacteraceae bacterium OM1]|nr:hypothetical protein E4K72_02695 [Oxalobacteraceae bacterium OM1]
MNRLPAMLTAIETEGSIALLQAAIGERRFTAMLVGVGDALQGWEAGQPVTLLFKETEVSLAKDLRGLISMRNRMPCRIVDIDKGRLLTRTVLDFDGRRIESIITTRAADALALAPGDAVEALVKANEMTVIRDAG